MAEYRTLWFDPAQDALFFIDQTRLPREERVVHCSSVERLVEGIRRLEIRGAPALGVAGAYGVVLATIACRDAGAQEFQKCLREKAALISDARPTAVNLAWGVNRVISRVREAKKAEEAYVIALEEADAIAREDGEVCMRLGTHGAELVPDGSTVLTHCNAGALACTRWGTALGVIRSAVRQGKSVKVFACETRPLLQGARLTAWELVRDGIEVCVIPDSAACSLMRKGMIDLVIVGADRITRDAVFNKIGTYMHAICARHHGIPFYVAAPLSTFDPSSLERDVIVEERPKEELSVFGELEILPAGAEVLNPAFDATPLELVDAIVTEEGVLYPPFRDLPCLHQ